MNDTKMNLNTKVVDLEHTYDKEFKPTQEYLDSLPDIQNGEYDGMPIDFVGIHDFKLPIRIKQRDGDTQEVTASISGSVSLKSVNRGINMSRIIRTFYKSKDDVFDINLLEKVLKGYQEDLKSFDAHILMNFEYRVWQDALRSTKIEKYDEYNHTMTREVPEGGWQYYNVTFDVNIDKTGEFKKILWFDYVYSSACPCSTELTVHNMLSRNKFGIPHSQRSCARIGIEFDGIVWIEDILDMCRNSIPTETLVFCKRIDEQAFSELNGSNPIFVEDAVRKLANALNQHNLIKDFKIIASHNESLHSHNAVAVITKGVKPSVFNHHVSYSEFESMRV